MLNLDSWHYPVSKSLALGLSCCGRAGGPGCPQHSWPRGPATTVTGPLVGGLPPAPGHESLWRGLGPGWDRPPRCWQGGSHFGGVPATASGLGVWVCRGTRGWASSASKVDGGVSELAAPSLGPAGPKEGEKNGACQHASVTRERSSTSLLPGKHFKN